LKLCETLSISCTPLRNALGRLAIEGLGVIIPKKGTFVSRVRFEDLIELFELREALEGMAVGLCMSRNRVVAIKQMEENLKIQGKAIENSNYNMSIENDLAYHFIFINLSRNSKIELMLQQISDMISRFAITTVDNFERQKQSYEEHKKIFSAIKLNNVDLAEKLVREHIVNVKEYHINKHYLY